MILWSVNDVRLGTWDSADVLCDLALRLGFPPCWVSVCWKVGCGRLSGGFVTSSLSLCPASHGGVGARNEGAVRSVLNPP